MAVIVPGPGVGPYGPDNGQPLKQQDLAALANTWDTLVYLFTTKLPNIIRSIERR
jgi:hypothetical protein